MFSSCLISTCDIQAKTLNQSGYEKVEAWATTLSAVPCRKDSDNGVSISDSEKRLNTDDDIFFFEASVSIIRGNRILFDTEYYDVIKINKVYDESTIHHIEVKARIADHN